VELYLHSATCLHGVHGGNVATGLFAYKHKQKGKFDSSDRKRERWKEKCFTSWRWHLLEAASVEDELSNSMAHWWHVMAGNYRNNRRNLRKVKQCFITIVRKVVKFKYLGSERVGYRGHILRLRLKSFNISENVSVFAFRWKGER